MSCHARGINPKDDQIRDHVAKNPKFFKRTDAEIIRALYVPKEKMRALMDEDTERFRKALEKTGNKVSPSEPVMNATLRYEADVDLPTLAAEIGLTPEELQARIVKSEVLSKSFGPLKAAGGTVPRQVVAQAFGDLVRDLRLGAVFQPGQTGETLPDNTGEVDPLEAQSSPANAVAFSPDGRWAAFASADKSVVIWDVAENRELRRCIGHTASVWCVAFSPDGSRLLSGGKDGTVRLWETRTARELHQFTGHEDLVTCVAFGPSGRWARVGRLRPPGDPLGPGDGRAPTRISPLTPPPSTSTPWPCRRTGTAAWCAPTITSTSPTPKRARCCGRSPATPIP